MTVWHSGHVDDEERQCGTKRTYLTRAEARAAARKGVGYGFDKLRPYRCPHCGSIHLGHPPNARNAQRKAS